MSLRTPFTPSIPLIAPSSDQAYIGSTPSIVLRNARTSRWCFGLSSTTRIFMNLSLMNLNQLTMICELNRGDKRCFPLEWLSAPSPSDNVFVVDCPDVIAHVADGQAGNLADIVTVLARPDDDQRSAESFRLLDNLLDIGLESSVAATVLATVAMTVSSNPQPVRT